MNTAGIIIGIGAFAAIRIFHPIVIKAEHHFSKRCWPVFLALGLVLIAASVFVANVTVSAVLAVAGFCSLWSIGELFKQEERVKKGWFPKKPKQ